MNYELAKRLKDDGFPQIGVNFDTERGFATEGPDNDQCYVPTLSELIEACPKKMKDEPNDGVVNRDADFALICGVDDKWFASYIYYDEACYGPYKGNTPEEAVANLWLILKGKS